MKSKKSFILIASALAAVLILSVIGYSALSDKVPTGEIPVSGTDSGGTETSSGKEQPENTPQPASSGESRTETSSGTGEGTQQAETSSEQESLSSEAGTEAPDEPESSAGTEAPQQSQQLPAVNRTADFTVQDADGNEILLSDFFGKPIIVNFWATWCGPCRSELPDFDQVYREYGNDAVFLMVNLTDGGRETVENVRAFVEEEGYVFPVYYDTMGLAADAYGISAIPTTVFIGKDGVKADTHIGIMDADTLRSGIDALL